MDVDYFIGVLGCDVIRTQQCEVSECAAGRGACRHVVFVNFCDCDEKRWYTHEGVRTKWSERLDISGLEICLTVLPKIG